MRTILLGANIVGAGILMTFWPSWPVGIALLVGFGISEFWTEQ